MTNFRLIFWWFCQGSPRPQSKKTDSPQAARLGIFMEKGANAVFGYDPTRENGIAERPQTLRYPENKK